MKVEHIEAKTAKDLTERINNFLSYVKKEHDSEPGFMIRESFTGKVWHGFIFFEEREK